MAVSELRKLTFSDRDRIPLPLQSCDKVVCGCKTRDIRNRRKYDRRSLLERRNELRFTTGAVDRRVRKGRRQQDNLWSGGYVY